MQTIYLAGPGVFRPDAHNWGLQLQQACQQFGLRGLYPLDQAAPANLSPAKTAAWIFAANCALIRQADAVFADVRAFRSISEPDSGTAFEIGFAHALGKPILLWLPDVPSGEYHDVGSGRPATRFSRVERRRFRCSTKFDVVAQCLTCDLPHRSTQRHRVSSELSQKFNNLIY